MLVITLKKDEPFRVCHEGVELWITVRKSGGKLKAYIEAPKELQISRVGTNQPSPAGSVEPATSVISVDSAGAVSA
jgi:sRNA-binding carbon storage regulator CsrA